jgi:putative transposase
VVEAADAFHAKTTAPNQLGQADFTYLKVTGWGWFYLSTVLDDFSRYVIAWKRCASMAAGDVTGAAGDVTGTLPRTRPRGVGPQQGVRAPQAAAAVRQRAGLHRRRACRLWLAARGMEHVRGAPCHPRTQGKIERWHRALKNRIPLENHYLPGELEAQVAAFVEHCNHRRVHESLDNLTPADVYFGRGRAVLQERQRIKRQTIQQRRLLHLSRAA